MLREGPVASAPPHVYSKVNPVMARKTPLRNRPRLGVIPKTRRAAVTREEYNRLVDMLNDRGELLNRIVSEQRIQFQRIAQLQVEVDRLKQVLSRLSIVA